MLDDTTTFARSLRQRSQECLLELERLELEGQDGKENKGEWKLLGNDGKRNDAAQPRKPTHHPFFQASKDHDPGDVLRFSLRSVAGIERERQPGKVVRCANGNLYWLDPEVGGGNDPEATCYYQYEPDPENPEEEIEATVIEFTADATVGRVWVTGAGAGPGQWRNTRKVRVVQKVNPETGETYVASAYPIP